MKAKTLTIVDTKNHQAQVLLLSDFLYNLLLSYQQQSATDFVFPGDGKTGYIVEPRKSYGESD